MVDVMKSTAAAHPKDVLFGASARLPNIAPCEHIAGNERFIQKALSLQAEKGPVFDITCDCEDGAVVNDAPLEHIAMIAEYIASSKNKFGRVGVRIHELDNPIWHEELKLLMRIAGQRVAYVAVPKVRSVDQVDDVRKELNLFSRAFDVPHSIPLHILIETPEAFRGLNDIASRPGIETLDFGLLDYISELGGAISSSCMSSPLQFEHQLLVRAKTRIVEAALSNSCVPSHNICVQVRDADAVFRDATRAKQEFGFMRMWSIHPEQIDPIVRALSPSYEEVELATSIIQRAISASWGPIEHDGVLHDRASYRYFWTLLERAKQSGVELPEEIEPLLSADVG
jgi:citrate lyase subunit beta/citryl-CoA lyase